MTMFIGQLALVTGGSQGIGRAIAVAGATVIIVGRRPDPVADAVALIRGAGGSADGLALDLVKTEDRATLVADIDGRSAGPDVLVHSAGTIARADVATASMTDLDHQYESNVRAPIALTQFAARDIASIVGRDQFASHGRGHRDHDQIDGEDMTMARTPARAVRVHGRGM
jgi:NAD(P)-dependent dehydrogenase (short-subunit alcohol dehydrogenase family)